MGYNIKCFDFTLSFYEYKSSKFCINLDTNFSQCLYNNTFLIFVCISGGKKISIGDVNKLVIEAKFPELVPKKYCKYFNC